MLLQEPLNQLAKELSYRDATEVVVDSLATEMMARISGFAEEDAYYRNKYNQSFEHFKVEYETGEEDFEKYDDLMAWEFACQGLAHWQKKLEALKHVS